MKLLLLSLLILSLGIPGILSVDATVVNPTDNTTEKPKVTNDNDPVPGSPLPYCYLHVGSQNMWFCYVGITPTQAEVDDYDNKKYKKWSNDHCNVTDPWSYQETCDSVWNPRLQMAYDRVLALQNQGRICEIVNGGIPIIYCFDMDRYFHDLENNKP